MIDQATPQQQAFARYHKAWRDTVLDTRGENAAFEQLDADEQASLLMASKDVGEVMHGMGKYDASKMTKEEWRQVMATLILGFEVYLAGHKSGALN